MKTQSAAPTEARVLAILDEYMAELRGGRTPDRGALLARHPELAESLAASFRALDFVHDAQRTLKAPEVPPGSEEPATAGRVLGDYRLVREIARGGMAVVYEAEQVSLKRRVALKVLPFAAVLDPRQLQRFKNEAQAAAQLQHPHIVPVHAVGCERGVHYYAMQYIEGQSLAVVIREMKERGGLGSPPDPTPKGPAEGPRTPMSSHGSNRAPAYVRMAAMLGIQAAQALDHAHQVGIVHRDVKPGNLLVDLAGTLWVTDFGLAHSLKDVGLTMTGELLGTIRYMSPEQALAKRVPIDHRTDVYSLGATLYELFTLEPAFPGEDLHRVIQDIASKEPVPPRRLNPALPRDVETVILKAMSKDPAARYATAQGVADDLVRFLENRPIEAKRPGLVRRAAKWSRRHRVLMGATAGVLVLAVAGLATGTALLWREKEQTQAAFAGAKANFALALEALNEIYMDEAEGTPQIREGLPRDLLERGLRFYEEFARANTQHRAAALVELGIAHLRAGQIFRKLDRGDRAKEAFDAAVRSNREAARLEPGDSAAHNNLGLTLYAMGDTDGAIAALSEAIRVQPDNAGAHGGLGDMLRSKGDLNSAIREYREAIRLKPDFAKAHRHLGLTLLGKGDRDGAITAFREAIRLKTDFADAHNDLGKALFESHDLDGATQEFREAIRLRSDFAEAHHNLGNALREGDSVSAIGEFREAIRIRPGFPEAHNNLGGLLRDSGDLNGAIAEFREAIRLQPDLAGAHYNLGKALVDSHDLDGAIRELREAIRLQPDRAEAHGTLGMALFDSHDVDGAIRELHEAIRLQPEDAKARSCLGIALRRTGQVEASIREFREAIRLQPDLAEAHGNLGNALLDSGDLGGALQEHLEGVRLRPDHAGSHVNLGATHFTRGDFDSAIEAYREAIRLQPELALAHSGLGNALREKFDWDGALRANLEAARIAPDDPYVQYGLGIALADKGRFQEALPWLRKAHEKGSSRTDWKRLTAAYPSGNRVRDVERMAELEGRLEQVMSGKIRPRDAVERIQLAVMLQRKSLHADAARMYAEAFAEDPALAGSQSRGGYDRYNAACSAALAAARGGEDASEWRARALEWLRADLAAREKAPSGRAGLADWKRDPDVATVRDRIDDLPEAERGAWRELWTAVDRALENARQTSR